MVGTPDALSVIQMHRTMPELYSEKFNEANFLNPTASMPFTTIVSYRVPQGLLGILEGVALSVNDLVQYDALVFQVRVNGNAILGYDNIRGPLGDIIYPHALYYPLYADDLVEVSVRNTLTNVFTFTTAAIVGRVFPDTIPQELLNMAVTRQGL